MRRFSVSRSGTRIQPDECFGWVPTWNRIPDRPGTLFTIGSRRLKRGDIVTLTVYHSASISTPRRSSTSVHRIPFRYSLPRRASPCGCLRISFSSIILFLVLIGLIGQISQISPIGFIGLLGSTPSLRGAGESIPIMIVNADEGARKGEYLAEGNQHAAVYHPRRGNTYPCCEQCAPEKDKSERQQQLTSGTSPVPSFKGGEFRVSAFSPFEGGVRGGLNRRG